MGALRMVSWSAPVDGGQSSNDEGSDDDDDLVVTRLVRQRIHYPSPRTIARTMHLTTRNAHMMIMGEPLAWRTEVEGDLLSFLFGSVRPGCRRLLTQELTVPIAQLADDLDISIVSQVDLRLVPHVTSRTLSPYLQWSACVEGFPSRIPPSRLDYLDPRDIVDPAFYRPPYADELEEIICEELAEESSEEEEENPSEDEGEPAQQQEGEEDELLQTENEEEEEEEDSEQGSGDDNDEEHADKDPQLEIASVADLPISNDPTLDPKPPQPGDGDVAQMAGPSTSQMRCSRAEECGIEPYSMRAAGAAATGVQRRKRPPAVTTWLAGPGARPCFLWALFAGLCMALMRTERGRGGRPPPAMWSQYQQFTAITFLSGNRLLLVSRLLLLESKPTPAVMDWRSSDLTGVVGRSFSAMAVNSKSCLGGGTSAVEVDDGSGMGGTKRKKSMSGTDPWDSNCHAYCRLKPAGQSGGAKFQSRFDDEDEKGIFRIRDPSSKVVQRWTRGFICLALVSVYLDPFFYLLPAVNLDLVCIYTQEWFAWSLTAARTILDCGYFFHMLFQFRIAYVKPCSRVFGRGELVTDRWAVAMHYLKGSFIIDLLAVLPLPQIVLWFVIPRVLGNPANRLKNILRILVLFQYIPRLYCIVHLAGKLRSSSGTVFEHTWAGIGVNLLALLLASHIAGASWYMLSVERMDTCWRQHCKLPACNVKNLDCLQQTRSAGIELTVAKDSCHAGSDEFNFGIYEEAIETIMHGLLLEKYVYSLWWGLRNVSSVGSNLVTSAYIGEILFCITISVIGLMIFTLLVANMQTYWMSLTTRLEEMRTSRRDTEYWMRHRRLPKDLRERVRRYESFKWAATRGVNEGLLLEKLPWDLRRDIKRHLAIDLIRKVPLFEKMDSNLQDAICLCLQQAMFVEGTVLIREDDPVQSMVFVIKGRMESSTTNGGRTGFLNTRQLRAGDFCGEELLTWALEPKSQHDSLPKSSRRVVILDEVEAFSLSADDLKYVASQFRRLHSKEIQHTLRCYSQQWQMWAACTIQAAWRRKKKREQKHREALREAKRAAGILLDPEDDSGSMALPMNVARVARGLTLTSSSATLMYDSAAQSRGNSRTSRSLEGINEEEPIITDPDTVNPKGTRLRRGRRKGFDKFDLNSMRLAAWLQISVDFVARGGNVLEIWTRSGKEVCDIDNIKFYVRLTKQVGELGNSKPCRRGGTSTVGADDGMEMVGAKGKKSTSGTDARDSSGHGYLQLKLTGQTGLARCCSSRFDNEEEKGIFRMRDPSSKVVQRWTRGFICLALVSVYLDPFFYLLPAVNLGAVCIYTQMWFALSLTAARTILDCAYFFHMLFQFRIAYVKPCSRVFGRGELVTDRWAVAIHYLKGSFIIDLLAVLPVPQIVLWFVIPRVVGNPANKLKNILRIMVLFQYIPRLYCIVHLAGKLRSSSGAVFEHAWAGIGVNLLVLLLVSHIAGAAWYMLSVERVDTCWRQHCKPPECNVKNLDCLQQAKDAYAELKVARDSCQPGSEDLSFNFGIYEEAIGTIMHGALLEKYIYSLWWGVRNVRYEAAMITSSSRNVLFALTHIGTILNQVLSASSFSSPEKLIGTRHGVVVLNRVAVETAIFDAETESFIRSASKEDGCTPRGVAGFNETQSQELLKLTLEFGGLGDRESLGCPVVNTIVRHKLNGVLDVRHRWDAGVRERRWENVVALSDEVTNCGLQVSRISCEFLSVSVRVRRRGGLDGRRRDGSRDRSHGDRRRIWLQRDELGVGTGWIIVQVIRHVHHKEGDVVLLDEVGELPRRGDSDRGRWCGHGRLRGRRIGAWCRGGTYERYAIRLRHFVLRTRVFVAQSASVVRNRRDHGVPRMKSYPVFITSKCAEERWRRDAGERSIGSRVRKKGRSVTV
ncbi:hypothetical protein CBR_g31681 [Chara braunii]|uniref:Cyclic nucleotide-binding domain-containing protein n=1 Tax=Chara braunii TaxID=69332 RepID=A0A388JY37_CHABU|nr:hypothetical protein CBR_g31681 [Chara braunii]|eukprot:GBG62662.1 hypothetical protein CBR_g31681 [Chara braunii]